MAIEVLDEHEQSELVRVWLHNNGGWIFAGLLAVVGIIVGSTQYSNWRAKQLDLAGSAYAKYLEAVANKDQASVQSLGDTLRKEHSGSPYAVLSAMSEAESLLDDGTKIEPALESLRWAKAHAKLPELQSLVSLRLARVLLQSGDLDQALSTLGEIQGSGFAAEVAELRGDILLAKGQAEQARSAYDEALLTLDATAPRRSLVEMKRDDLALAGANATAAAGDAAKVGG